MRKMKVLQRSLHIRKDAALQARSSQPEIDLARSMMRLHRILTSQGRWEATPTHQNCQ
jgi:hypothetical protein